MRNHQRFPIPATPMPQNRTRAAIILAWFLFWIMMVAVAVQDYARDDGTAYWQPILWETSSMLAATLLLLIQRHFTEHHDAALLPRPARWFALQFAWLPLYWTAFVPLAFGMRHAVYALMGQVYQHEAWGETFLYESLKLSVFVSLFFLIRFGILSYHQLLEEKLRVERANALLRQAQLQRLAQQMQPHFLFNALNTISSLMHTDVDKADATLIQLAEVLRTTLDVSDLHEAPLSTELRLAQGYARVMQERYADRVAIEWQIGDDTLACTLPVMSIQPLLENVFKHTVEKRRQLTHVTITIVRDADMLCVTLDDDTGTFAPSGKPGIGLSNLRERLEVLYGARATLTLSQREPAGVRAAMRIPCAF
ncbi:sensor histidine kinase [Massilia sp. CF038]|uniref:sensor histidine kinase n=1 Tax=Massilia sp. CF038 TaxID=1881045 RepID=UPI0009109A9E|nr:histidine kinase [Massilia sp. CF038]SHG56770.1 Histidine kinase [Massilia sp. CF038]